MIVDGLVFLFSPYPDPKGNVCATKATWRILFTSTFAFGMNGGQTRGKWDIKLAVSMLLLSHTDMMGASVHKGVEFMGGWILNSL